jgi:Transposase DNA-binding/Transposase DDE domain
MSLGAKAIERVGAIFQRADLGDPRRVRRAVGLAESLAKAPQLTLPKVWSTPAELEAGYRFLRSPHTEFCALMEAVQRAAREAALRQGACLVLHDTTDVDSPSAKPEEVGFLQTGKAGFRVHHALCVSADGSNLPLGMLWSQLWGRPRRSSGRSKKTAGSELAKLKERESDRWLEGATEAHLWTEGCGQVVHVMDREGDAYRLFHHMHQLGADYVIRMRHDRRLEEEDGRLAETLAAEPIKLQRLVFLSARKQRTMPSYTHQGRPARQAQLHVRCRAVELRAPKYLADEPIELNVVQVLEENPPDGQEPVSWVLATTLPIKTRAQIERVLDIYRARWVIEEFHKALKTGCMFEKRQLESFESITSLLAICYPIACELLRVRTRARQTGLPAAEVLRKTQLDCLRAHPKARPMGPNPTAEEALAVVAGLGGHIKYNGPPGWQTLAAGYMELLAFERGWIAALASRNL